MAPKTNKHLTPFEIGQIKAHLYHEVRPAEIQRLVRRENGEEFCKTAIHNAVAKLQENPDWRGERQEGSGRPRETDEKTDAKLEKTVQKERGKRKVTVSYLKRTHPEFRKLSNSLVEERLHSMGYKYLPRRDKTLVTPEYVQGRLDYAAWIKRQSTKYIESIAFTDGTTYFLDTEDSELELTKRRVLGSRVWKMWDGSESLYKDCVGPGGYKNQGDAVRIWGLLANGLLKVWILPKGQVMNSEIYCELVEDDDGFEEWLGSCSRLVCDFERALRTADARDSLKRVGLEILEQHAKCSQDLNPIENIWRLLRERLYETLPKKLETREHFEARVHSAVRWLNYHKQEEMWYLSTNLKERADDVIYLEGGRTGW